jgi:ribonuclease P protein component
LLTRKNPIREGKTVSPKNEGSFRFKREEHLKKRNEIREVFGKGKRFGCRGAKLFLLKNGLPRNRICFTFSRGFGTAVQRNRAKRISREAYRNLKPRLQRGYDIILLLYPNAPDKQEGQDCAGQLRYLFSKAGLLTNGARSRPCLHGHG